MQSESSEYRLPKAVENAIKRPVREAVGEALAEASVTVEADETDADATAGTSGDDSNGESDSGPASSESSTGGRSGSRRRRGLLGLGVLVPLVGLAAVARYRRERDGSSSVRESAARNVADVDADSMPLSTTEGE